MPNDPLDDVVGDLAADAGAQRAQALKGSLYQAVGKNPDQVAENNRTGAVLGVPGSFVENDPSLKQQAAQKALDPDALAVDHPKTAGFLSDPDIASIAHDDVDNLKSHEQVIHGHSYMQQIGSAILAGSAKLGELPGQLAAAAYNVAAIPQNLLLGTNTSAPASLTQNSLNRYYAGQAKVFEAQAPEMTADMATQLKQGRLGDLSRSVGLQLANQIPMLIAAGMAPGAHAGAAVFAAQGAGEKIQQLQDQGKVGPAATVSAIVHGGAQGIMGELGSFAPVQGLAARITAQIGKPAARAVMRDAFQAVAQSVAGGAAGGALQVGLDTMTDAAMGDSNATNDLYEKLGVGALGGAVQGLAFTGAHLAAHLPSMLMDARASNARSALGNMGDLVEKSKVADRSPEAMRSFLQSSLEGSDLATIHMDPAKFDELHTKHGIDPQQAAVDLGIGEEYKTAKDAGTALPVKTAELLSQYRGMDLYNEILDHASLGPNEPTFSEMAEVRTQREDEAAKKLDEFQTSTQKVYEARKAEIEALHPDMESAQVEADAQRRAQMMAAIAARVRTFGPEHADTLPEHIAEQYPNTEITPEEMQGKKDAQQIQREISEGKRTAEGLTPEEDAAFQKHMLDLQHAAVASAGGVTRYMNFIKQNGGLNWESVKADGELKESGAENFGIRAKKGGGLKPDEMAQMMVNEGLLPSDALPGDMYEAIKDDIRRAKEYNDKYGKGGYAKANRIERLRNERFRERSTTKPDEIPSLDRLPAEPAHKFIDRTWDAMTAEQKLQAVSRDQRTGLLNETGLQIRLDAQGRPKDGSKVVRISIGNHKFFNEPEQGGHQAGDQYLQMQAEAVRRAFPEAAKVGVDFVATGVKDEADMQARLAVLKKNLSESAQIGNIHIDARSLRVAGELGDTVAETGAKLGKTQDTLRAAGEMEERGERPLGLIEKEGQGRTSERQNIEVPKDIRAEMEQRIRRHPGAVKDEAFMDRRTLMLNDLGGHTVPDRKSIAHLDMDHMGAANKIYTREAGDALLTVFAAKMHELNRSEDFKGHNFDLVRNGGDEFEVRGDSHEATHEFARRLEDELVHIPVEILDKDGKVQVKHGITFSAGIGGSHEEAEHFLLANKAERAAERSREGFIASIRPAGEPVPVQESDVSGRLVSGVSGLGATDGRDSGTPGVPEGGEAGGASGGLRTLEQSRKTGESPRGELMVPHDLNSSFEAFMTRYAKANASTAIHEDGHYALEVMRRIALLPDATPEFKSDLKQLEDFAGVKYDAQGQAIWDKPAHEKIALAMEKYVMEGKAPSIELRSAFRTLQGLMISVYRSVRNILGPQLDDDTRKVFDRMMATPEQIELAQRALGHEAWKNTDGSYLDTPEYNKAIKDATERAKEKLTFELNRDIRREQTKAYKAEYDRNAEDVRAELKDSKEYKAVRAFQGKDAEGNDVPPLKINRKMLAEDYGIEHKNDLPKGAVVKEGGDHPDVVAEKLGYENAQEMFDKLRGLPKLEEAVAKKAKDITSFTHGDAPSDTNIADLAMNAIHNVDRTKIIRLEQEAMLRDNPGVFKSMMRKMGVLMPDDGTLQNQAHDAIMAQRGADLNPNLYAVAEAKARREAMDLYAKGDIQGAFDAKRRERLNHELYRTAADAKEAVSDTRDFLKRFSKDSVREKIDLDHRDQIDAILARYDLGQVSKKSLDRKASLPDFLETMAGQGHTPYVSEFLLNEMEKTNFKEMPVKDFLGLGDSVRSIEMMGRGLKEVKDGLKKIQLEDVAQEVADTTAGLKQRGAETNRGLTTMDAAWLKAKSFGRSMASSLLKMEQLIDWADDRNPNGPLNRTVFRPIADAGQHELELHTAITEHLNKAAKEFQDTTEGGRGQIYTADGLIDGQTGQPQKFTHKEMLALAGNMGNRSNIEKLLKGENWDEQAVWNFLHKNMTKADWDFVKAYADSFEMVYKEKLAMNRRLGNTDPQRVEPAPFTLPTGEKYAGWYWPMIYDPARAQDVAERGAKKGDALFENIYTRANTDTGRMNTRIEGYARPLLLSLDAIPKVIADEIHDVSYREAIINADKVLSHPQVRDSLVNAFSQEHYDQFRPWLQSIANDTKGDMKGLDWFDKVARGARTRATMVGLGFRLTTMMVHGASAGMESAAEVGPTWFAKGLAAFARPENWQKNIDFMMEHSSEMPLRLQGEMDRDVRENLKDVDQHLGDPTIGAVARGYESIKARAFQGISMLDLASAAPTWMAGYLKGMAPESQGGMGLSEKDAVFFADKTVRNAHGGGGVKDLARIQRGNEFQKLFTMFYSFWNHNANRLMDTGRQAMDSETWKDSGRAGTVVMRTLAYVFGVQAMHALFHKDEQGEHWYQWAAKAMANAAAGGIPIARDLVSYATGERDYSLSPVAQMVSSVHQSQVDAMNAYEGKHVSDRWVKHAIQNTGYVFGVPGAGQGSNTAQFLMDVGDGTQNPQGFGDWWNGVVTGHTKQK